MFIVIIGNCFLPKAKVKTVCHQMSSLYSVVDFEGRKPRHTHFVRMTLYFERFRQEAVSSVTHKHDRWLSRCIV